MRVIEVSVRDKLAIRTNDIPYVCDNSDYCIKFDFDDEWGEYTTKTARFVYDEKHIDVVFDGDTCPIPIMSDISRIYVGVFAGNLRTTTSAIIYARRSITNAVCNISANKRAVETVSGRLDTFRYSALSDVPFVCTAKTSPAAKVSVTPQNGKVGKITGTAVDVTSFSFSAIELGTPFSFTVSHYSRAFGAPIINKRCIIPYSSIESLTGEAGTKGFILGTFAGVVPGYGAAKFSDVYIQISENNAILTATVDGYVASYFGMGEPFDVTICPVEYTEIPLALIPDAVQRVGEDIILASSAPGSDKRFKLTVDDTGTLTATKITS